MSAQEHAALKIQDAWRKYQESKDSCPICLKIIGEDSCKTKCGHRFCTGCLLKAVQRNGSCPLCRGELIEGQGVAQDQEADEIFSHERMMSMFDGDELDPADPHYQFNLSDQDYENAVNESIAASQHHQRGYAEGIEDGRRESEEEFQSRMREEIDIATQKAYDDGVVQGRSLASEEIRLLREENQRLKKHNSRMREDIQFHTQRFYSPSI